MTIPADGRRREWPLVGSAARLLAVGMVIVVVDVQVGSFDLVWDPIGDLLWVGAARRLADFCRPHRDLLNATERLGRAGFLAALLTALDVVLTVSGDDDALPILVVVTGGLLLYLHQMITSFLEVTSGQDEIVASWWTTLRWHRLATGVLGLLFVLSLLAWATDTSVSAEGLEWLPVLVLVLVPALGMAVHVVVSSVRTVRVVRDDLTGPGSP